MKNALFFLSLTLLLSACLSENGVEENQYQFQEDQRIIGIFEFIPDHAYKGGPNISNHEMTYFLDLNGLAYSEEQYLKWQGQLVEINGTTVAYYCSKQGQCLMGGVIHYLIDIDSIESLNADE